MSAGKATSASADRVEAVYAAIVALGEATANEIAATAAMAYPTVTPKLRALADAGRAEFFRDATGKGKWRITTPTSPEDHQPETATAVDQPSADAPSTGEHTDAGTDEGNDVDGTDLHADATTATVEATLATEVASDHQTLAPAPDETAPGDLRQPPTGDGNDTEAPEQPAADGTDAVEQPAPRVRRPNGSIATALLAILQSQPDTSFKVSQLSKLIDAGAGAVANSLNKLTADGTVRMVVEHPATYQAN